MSKIVIVAAKMDDSTERMIRYLKKYEVDINIMFFHVVCCGTKRLISRAWFEENVKEQRPDPKSIRQWNQEYYVSFGNKEIGFFGNQNSVCRPRDQKWVYTVERLKKVWEIDA